MGNANTWGNQIGRRLKERREAAGLSQAEVAARIDTSQQNYQKFETGKTLIGLEYLLMLPQVLGCKLTDLLPDSVVTDYDEERAADPRLAEVIAGWGELPDFLRDGITGMVRDAAKEFGRKKR